MDGGDDGIGDDGGRDDGCGGDDGAMEVRWTMVEAMEVETRWR